MEKEFLNKVKAELEASKGYDFQSEFWDDEMNTMFYEIVDASMMAFAKDFNELNKRLSDLDNLGKKCLGACGEKRNTGNCEECFNIFGIELL